MEPPADLQAELRPYQRQGLDWLQFLRAFDLGGVLADDMGLGKTVQTLAHLLVEKAAGRADRPSLVVAPTSLMFNWQREAQRFAPTLKVLLLRGQDRQRHFQSIAEHDLVLTHLSAAAARPRRAGGAGLASAHPGRGPGDQEPAQQGRPGDPRADRPAPAVPDRHAAGEPPRRALVAARLSDAGHARRRASLPAPVPHPDRAPRRRRPQRAAAPAHRALPAASHQGGGGHRAAAEDRDPARGAAGRRPARPLRDPAPGAAREGAGGDRAQGHGAERHHHPRRAAEAAPGLLRPAPGVVGQRAHGQGLRQARTADDAVAGTARGGPPRAAVLPVHQHAGADRDGTGQARPARKAATSSSSPVAPATAPRRWMPSRPARCRCS